jgi:hypothetical protein
VTAVRERIQLSRRLPLDSAALHVALLFFALDTLSDSRRWTLGPLGAIELDPHFTPIPSRADDGRSYSASRGRLCAPDGFMVAIEIVLTTSEGSEPRLTLHADPVPDAYRSEMTIAGRAGLEELAEELHFFGTRQHAVS